MSMLITGSDPILGIYPIIYWRNSLVTCFLVSAQWLICEWFRLSDYYPPLPLDLPPSTHPSSPPPSLSPSLPPSLPPLFLSRFINRHHNIARTTAGHWVTTKTWEELKIVYLIILGFNLCKLYHKLDDILVSIDCACQINYCHYSNSHLVVAKP